MFMSASEHFERDCLQARHHCVFLCLYVFDGKASICIHTQPALLFPVQVPNVCDTPREEWQSL